jgi:hypothetical protein
MGFDIKMIFLTNLPEVPKPPGGWGKDYNGLRNERMASWQHIGFLPKGVFHFG